MHSRLCVPALGRIGCEVTLLQARPQLGESLRAYANVTARVGIQMRYSQIDSPTGAPRAAVSFFGGFRTTPGARDIVRGRHPIFTKPALFFHVCTSDRRRHTPAPTMLRTPEEKSLRCHDRTEHGWGHTVATASSARGKTMVFITPGNRTPVHRSTVKPSRSCRLHWHGRGLVCRLASKSQEPGLCWLSDF